jgi:hypothetical protein
MSTLKQKLPRIPSPIREMIIENINSYYGRRYNATRLMDAFEWANAKHIPDHDFWDAIDDEILLMQ